MGKAKGARRSGTVRGRKGGRVMQLLLWLPDAASHLHTFCQPLIKASRSCLSTPGPSQTSPATPVHPHPA